MKPGAEYPHWPEDRRQRRDHLHLEVEVWRHGSQRSTTAEESGGRKPAAEAVGGRSQPGQGSAQGDRAKKRLELAGLRTDVAFAMEQYEMSERQACKLVDLDRSSYRYKPRPDHNAELRQELVHLARQKPRYGYRRLHAVLSRRGSPVSAQRVYRVYRAEGLTIRRLR